MATLPALDPRWHSLETLETYATLANGDRRALAAAIAAALGPDFAPHTDLLGQHRFAAIEHARTRTTFCVIPGGDYQMGIRPEERDELIETINAEAGRDQTGDVEYLMQVALPVHRVRVYPFLFAVDPMDLRTARSMSHELAACDVGRGRFSSLDEIACIEPREAGAVIAGAPSGFRLPCEAEWEWVAREGGERSWIVAPNRWLGFKPDEDTNAFGVTIATGYGEWLADAWTPNHEGAPDVAVARVGGASPGVGRGVHSGWQDAIEAVVTACAYREQASPNSDRWLRFARDLPRA